MMIVWRNNTGPMIGISPSTGMGRRWNRGGELRIAELGLSTFENRKLVSPMTSTLSTTPTITWSTRYLMEKVASTNDTSTPATTAAMSPATSDWVMDATTADAKAPASSWPSIATFTTPTRSEMTPPSAPKISGALSPTAPTSSPGTGMVAPAAAQLRKATRNRAAKTEVSHRGVETARYARQAESAAMPNSTIVTTIVTIATSAETSGNWMRSLLVDRRNMVTPLRAPTVKSSSAITAKTPRPIGGFQLRTAARSRPVVVAVWVGVATLTWSPSPSG